MTKGELITIGITGSITAFCIYQYSKAVKDYNELLDRNIAMSNFIRDHDFYEKCENFKKSFKSNPTPKKSIKDAYNSIKNSGGISQRYHEMKRENLGNGKSKVVFLDAVSGFEVVTVKKNKDICEESKEA